MEPVAGVIKVAGTEWLLVGAACTMGKQVLYLEGNCVDGTEGFGSGAVRVMKSDCWRKGESN